MKKIHLHLDSEANKKIIIEQLKVITRNLILNYDKWETDNDKQISTLGQHILMEAKKYIEKCRLTKINILASQEGLIEFDFETYQDEIIQEIKKYTLDFFKESPSSELLMEYISLVSTLGEKPKTKATNHLLCIEIYKLRNKSVADELVEEKIQSNNSEMVGLSLAFEEAKQSRKKQNINQPEISDYLGCSTTTISHLENRGIEGRDKNLILGYISYIKFKTVFSKCKLDVEIKANHQKQKGDY